MNRISKLLLDGVLVVSVFIFIGCTINSNSGHQYESQRSVQLQAPMEEGMQFKAQTHNGSIKIEGADVDVCQLKADIEARAESMDAAAKLVEQINVSLESVNNGLVVSIDKPLLKNNQSISVSLYVTLPRSVNLALTTHNGSVEVSDVRGNINSITHNGGIEGRRLNGKMDFETHNGKVLCQDIDGSCRLITHNGSVEVSYSDIAPGVCDAFVETHNGSVEFIAPSNLSAKVELSTHNGSIHTRIPIMTVGEIDQRQITGTIGQGDGKLSIKTYNGSISLK